MDETLPWGDRRYRAWPLTCGTLVLSPMQGSDPWQEEMVKRAEMAELLMVASDPATGGAILMVRAGEIVIRVDVTRSEAYYELGQIMGAVMRGEGEDADEVD